MFENPRRGRQARHFIINVPKNSRSQIVFRTHIFQHLTLGASDCTTAKKRLSSPFQLKVIFGCVQCTWAVFAFKPVNKVTQYHRYSNGAFLTSTFQWEVLFDIVVVKASEEGLPFGDRHCDKLRSASERHAKEDAALLLLARFLFEMESLIPS